MNKEDDFFKDIADTFMSGAYGVAIENGMTEKDAYSFATNMCKEAARRDYDDDEDEEDTFWGRNKWWLIPTLVGTGAWWLGSNSERHGLPNRGRLSNTWDNIRRRLRGLFGLPDEDNPTWRAMTQTPKPHPNTRQLDLLNKTFGDNPPPFTQKLYREAFGDIYADDQLLDNKGRPVFDEDGKPVMRPAPTDEELTRYFGKYPKSMRFPGAIGAEKPDRIPATKEDIEDFLNEFHDTFLDTKRPDIEGTIGKLPRRFNNEK